ncbi:MAG: hypothetical protein F4058_05140 [Rhodothermaceae bacterium]|nr:hypothetical protein [Rhodothermaceae bacterium]MYF63587.1 hypothetical protein [Rhodothermaceae bacterium]MYI84707.1 hypothetical protein [Rhodothermaceae bacterium]
MSTENKADSVVFELMQRRERLTCNEVYTLTQALEEMAGRNANSEIKALKSTMESYQRELAMLKWVILSAMGLFALVVGIIALVLDK